MNLLRKTLSGGLGRNLLNLSFSTAQVVDSPEHKLLMALRDSQLQDQDAVEAFSSRWRPASAWRTWAI